MEIHSLRPLKTIDDWIEAVGRKNWVPSYSAYECAMRWRGVTSVLPEPLNYVMRNSGIEVLQGLRPESIVAEHAVFLDTLTTPSRTDIMAFCSNSTHDRVVVAVEAKSREPFSDRVFRWIRTADRTVSAQQQKLFDVSNAIVVRKERRLAFLNQVLGTNIDINSELRYQLVHRTASAVLEARNLRAKAAIVVIQAFQPSVENLFDFSDYLDALNVSGATKNRVLGPYFALLTPSTPLYFLYLQDRPSTQQARLFT